MKKKPDKTEKNIIEIHENIRFQMDMATNLKKLKFLDVTLDQTKGIFRSYEKPNDAFFMSATHPTLFRTSSREVMPPRLFNSAKVECEDVLEMNNHKASLKYTARNT